MDGHNEAARAGYEPDAGHGDGHRHPYSPVRGLALRDYQVQAIDAAMSRFAGGHRAALIQLPTGTGKTVLGLELARRTGRTLWLAHRDELVQQPRARAGDVWPGVDVGVVAAEVDQPQARDLIVASTQTLMRSRSGTMPRLEAILAGGLDLVVADEAHHYVDGEGRAFDRPIRAALERTGARLLGLTATSERGDGTGLGVFGEVVFSLQLREAISRGYLAPFGGFRRVRVEGLEHTGDELKALARGRGSMKAEQALASRVEEQLDLIVRSTVDAWRAHGRRPDGAPRRGVIFTVLVSQAEATAEAMRKIGIRAAVVSGETPTGQRRVILDALRNGQLDVVCNCAVLTEGFDAPVVDAVLLARPCASRTLFLQSIGRASRLHPGKADWIVIDLGGGSDLHGLEVAPLLDGQETGGQGEGDPRDGPTGPRRLMGDPVPPEPVRWLQVREGVLAASVGGGETVVVQFQAGRWLVRLLRKRGEGGTEALGKYSDEDLALGVGADAVRRLGGLRVSAARSLYWRSTPPSPQQLEAARKWKAVVRPGATRGEVSDLITRAVVLSRVGRSA